MEAMSLYHLQRRPREPSIRLIRLECCSARRRRAPHGVLRQAKTVGELHVKPGTKQEYGDVLAVLKRFNGP